MKVFVGLLLLSATVSFAMEEEGHLSVRVSTRLANKRQYVRYQEERDQLLERRNLLIRCYGVEKPKDATEEMKEETFCCNKESLYGRIRYHRAEQNRWRCESLSPLFLSLLGSLCARPERMYASFMQEQCIGSQESAIVSAGCCCCSVACLALGCFGVCATALHWKAKNDARKELAVFDRIEQLRPLNDTQE